MRKIFITSMIMCGLIFSIAFNAQGQLFAPFKSESASVGVVQLPIADKKFNKLTVKTTQKAVLGEKANEATKKASEIAGKFGVQVEDQTGTVTDKESEPVEHKLIPDIFPTKGDALLEVHFYEETMIKMPDEPMKFYDGAEYEVKVEYKLYSMPGKELVEEVGPHWVAADASSTAGPNQSRQDAYNDRLKIAREWATREIMRKYALKHKSIYIDVYTLKSFKDANDDKQDEAQEKLLSLAGKFRKEHKKDEYKKQVKELIPVYENFLSMHKPGKDADVNDRNVFALYYNLALCHYLVGELQKADEYVKKGAKVTKIDWKEVKNNKGEVIGRKRAGIVHVTEDIFHNLKADFHAYHEGMKANDPKFVSMLTDEGNFKKISNTVRNAAANLHLSTAMNIDMPLDIASNDFTEAPKHVSGTISKDGAEVAKFEIKKNPFAFIMRHKEYKVTLTKTDGSVTAKQHLYGSMNPGAEYDFVRLTGRKSFIGLPEEVRLGRVKPLENKHSKSSNNIMFKYNGEVNIKNYSLYDKWIYINFWWVEVDHRDALLVNQSEINTDFANYKEIDKIDKEFTVIKRERKLGIGGFFKAIGQKSFQRKPISSTELSKDKDDIKLEVKSKKKVEKKDEKGNWTEMSYGDYTISRTIAY